MNQNPQQRNGMGWLEASGLLQIVRALMIAVQPGKLAIGLIGIYLTFVLGGLLDLAWSQHGVGETAITQFILAREADRPYLEPEGTSGIFEVWRKHEKRCVLGVLGSSVPGSSMAGGTLLGSYLDTHTDTQPLRNVVSMVYGGWWLLRYHSLYFVLFVIGFLLIWSWCGGAICRMAALQSARGERLAMRDALRYSREKLVGGFFLAPIIPIGFILITAIFMVLGGALLRVPVVGDLICGIAFGLAILGGFIIAILLVGLFIGGNLLWPAVAVEGSDAFDAFQRSLSYPLSKPWKWILYTIIAIVYAAICWIIVNLFTYFMLLITRVVVSFGTSPCGWWNRGTEEEPISKLELLWPLGGPNAMHAWPTFEGLFWWEYTSAILVGVWVLITISLVWSFLVSMFFSTSTVIYCLLRRDVDDIDMGEVYVEEEETTTGLGSAEPAEAPAGKPSDEASAAEPSPQGGAEKPGDSSAEGGGTGDD